jgi:hypothetical protein
MRLRMPIQPLLVGALLVWILGVGAGFAHVLDYAFTPGNRGTSPTDWPSGSSLRPDPGRANLVLLAHPHCPCSRVSIDQLEQIMVRCQGQVTAHVLFYRPSTFPENWEKTDLWHHSAAIPGMHVVADTDASEAQRFGAATSGHVLLFHADGHLLFRGGITNSRGHAGASLGSEAIVSLLTTGTTEHTETPVFGCPLSNPLLGNNEGHEACCKQ